MVDAGLLIHHGGKNMYAYAKLHPYPLRSIGRNVGNDQICTLKWLRDKNLHGCAGTEHIDFISIHYLLSYITCTMFNNPNLIKARKRMRDWRHATLYIEVCLAVYRVIRQLMTELLLTVDYELCILKHNS